METVFFDVFNRSLTAGWLILAVLLLRLGLKKAPRWLPCALWGLVGLRLICPFSLESAVSLIPSANPVPVSILYDAAPSINSGMTAVDTVVNGALNNSMAPIPGDSVNPLQVVGFIAAWVWLAGMVLMLLYSAISTLRLRRRVRAAARLEDGLWQGDEVASPFILGVFRPRIYLPSTLPVEDRAYVLAHEHAHLKRRDHWWKPLGFLLLAVHWFNPLVWVAYHLLCRDIEIACDQRVTRDMAAADKQGYSSALLACGVPRRLQTACPLAFGEVGVKARIKAVLHYKKPALWLIITAVVACAAVGVVFLTDPVAEEPAVAGISPLDNDSDVGGVQLLITGTYYGDEGNGMNVEWYNSSGYSLALGHYTIYRKTETGWEINSSTIRGQWGNPQLFHIVGSMDDDHAATAVHAVSYPLEWLNLDEEGIYRLEGHFRVEAPEGGEVPARLTGERKAWVDFRLQHTVLHIQQAKEIVIRKFNRDFKGGTLTDLWYDKPFSDAEAEHWAKWYDADEAIVLLSNFVTGETYYGTGLETNATYKNWCWILVRDKGGDWELKDWGYA